MSQSFRLQTARGEFDLDARTHVMGILNLTPDSFSDGGAYASVDAAADRGLEMVRQGADFIDVGGESTRPGSSGVTAEEESARVLPVIERLRGAGCEVPISIDTTKAEVAQRALDAGADLVNDVSAMRADPDMAAACAEAACPVILMHMRGRPREMQAHAEYDDVVADVAAELSQAMAAAVEAGVKAGAILLDPGIGFAKHAEHSLQILARLDELVSLGRPLVLGASRKSFIGHVLDLPVEQRLEASLAVTALGIASGVRIVRVHDVKENVRAARMADAIRRAAPDGREAHRS